MNEKTIEYKRQIAVRFTTEEELANLLKHLKTNGYENPQHLTVENYFTNSPRVLVVEPGKFFGTNNTCMACKFGGSVYRPSTVKEFIEFNEPWFKQNM